MNEWSWEKILCSDPEMLIRQASRQSETEDDSPLALQRKALDERRQSESLRNPTDAMKEILKRIEERELEREQMTWQQQLQHLKKNLQRSNSENEGLQNPNPLTPAMEEVIAMRQKRISVEIDIPITPEPSDSENDYSDCDSFSSHEEYLPKPAKKSKKSRQDPFEFNDDEREEVGVYKSPYKSCLNIVNTGSPIKTYERPKKRRLSQDSQDFQDSEPEIPEKPVKPAAKKRRISIQNEATPIRNKDSPDQVDSKITKKCPKVSPKGPKTAKRGRKKTIQAKRLSSIPEQVFIETTTATTTPATPVTKKTAKTKVKAVRRATQNTRQNMRSSDAKMRTTRAQDWKWENVLISNPERMLRSRTK